MSKGIYKRKPFTEEHKKNIGKGHKGIKKTKEAKEKISIANKGHIVTEETRRKISKSNKGKPSPLKGIKLSEEHKRKVSEAKKGINHQFYGKHLSEEHRRKIGNANRTHGLSNDKGWHEKYNEKYYEKNKERERKRASKYRKENRYSVNENQKRYYKQRYKKDPQFRILLLLRGRLTQAIRDYSKIGKIRKSKDYGISYKEIIEHLKPFPKDTSKYHIDHIKPLCSFNLTNFEEVKKAFAPENHQWLLVKDNLKKIEQDKKQSLK